MNLRGLTCFVVLATVGACGGAQEPETPEPARRSVSSSSDSHAAAATTPEAKVPNRCVERKNACMPPIKWAERLCGDVYQDLALYMFQQGTPWTRFYLKVGLNAVNGWGPTVDEDMVSQEEVLVINHRLTRDALEVEGSLGTYDVMRWNGSCVTLDVNEVTKRTPSRPRNSRIDWRSLSNDMQDALLEDGTVAEIYEARRKECRGASIGRVTARCEELDKKLMAKIAEFVRNTRDLPTPENVPQH